MAGAGGWIARAVERAGLPRGTVALIAVRFLLYLGVQASYFIGVIGALTYQTDATTVDLACAVGLFNLFIIAGNAAGGSLLDVHGPRVHTAVALFVAFSSCIAFQFVEVGVGAVLVMGAAFGFATGVGFAYLSSYPAYLSAGADELHDLVLDVTALVDGADDRERVNGLLSVVSNGAVVLGPAVGGVIAAALPVQRVFLFSAVCAVAAAFPAARLLVHASARRGRAGATGDDATTEPRGSFAESARAVLVHPSLALLFWVGVLAYAGYGALDPLESLYYRDVLAVDISWMGWLSSAAGAGSVAGAALAMRLPRRLVNVRTLLALIAFEGLACWLYVGTPYLACALIGQLLLGAAFGMVTPLTNTLVQMHAPLHMLGRVNSVMNAGFNGAGVVPLLAAPALANMFGVPEVMVAASIAVCMVPTICLVVRRERIARLVAAECAGETRRG